VETKRTALILFPQQPAMSLFRWVFTGGVILTAALVMFLYLKIRETHAAIGRELALTGSERPREVRHTVVVPVPAAPNRIVLAAVEYARSMSPEVIAVHVNTEQHDIAGMHAAWKKFVDDVPLIILESPHRSVLRPLLRFIDEMADLRTDDKLTVVLPELVPDQRWQGLLHNRISTLLKEELLYRPGVIVTSVRYHMRSTPTGTA
jgi:hypothetical protein